MEGELYLTAKLTVGLPRTIAPDLDEIPSIRTPRSANRVHSSNGLLRERPSTAAARRAYRLAARQPRVYARRARHTVTGAPVGPSLDLGH